MGNVYFQVKISDDDDDETSSDDAESNSVPVKVDLSFAEQLAAKLGNVINQQLPQQEGVKGEEEIVNKKPIQKRTVGNTFSAGLFDDEPPPLDDDDDLDDDGNGKKGLFSGGEGLFDNDDDFITKKPKITSNPQNVSFLILFLSFLYYI